MRTKLTFLAILPLLLVACSGAAAQASLQTITVEAQGMHYQPASIEVTAGQPVEITLKNGDSVDHDFSVMEFPLVNGTPVELGSPVPGHDMDSMSGMGDVPALHTAAAMGMTSTLKFTPGKPGTYTFYCTVAGHKDAGMMGTLIVKAP
jgi:uncharacterized cupredoxin-like copper-binding protein